MTLVLACLPAWKTVVYNYTDRGVIVALFSLQLQKISGGIFFSWENSAKLTYIKIIIEKVKEDLNDIVNKFVICCWTFQVNHSKMSAKKQRNIQDFFSRKLSSASWILLLKIKPIFDGHLSKLMPVLEWPWQELSNDVSQMPLSYQLFFFLQKPPNIFSFLT